MNIIQRFNLTGSVAVITGGGRGIRARHRPGLC